MDGLESMNIWETVDRPEGANLIDSKLVLQVKTDTNNIPYKFKARFCVQGFSQRERIDYNEIFTLVVPRDAIWTLLVITARFDWEIDSIDITQAYLNADLHHSIYLKPPEGAEVLAGTGETQVIIMVYVDNMLITLPLRNQIDQVKGEIIDKWKITDNGLAKEFLKIIITWDCTKWTINLDQWAYIKEIIKEWIRPHEKTWTPMTHTPLKAPPDSKVDEKLKNGYPTLVGKLLWISNTVRPDILFTINVLACHMSRPMEEAMKVALLIVMYLNQTQDEVLRLGSGDGNEPAITAYTDSNWASDLNTDRRSMSSSIVKVSVAW
ncbi:uncharacterized protein UBRO_20894 [Ustilago bromivora]|uniref:Reverse transcriptase Ty1/copia-type domain-containing protein n=1 Tax=Ustilago bromivora TaxID=307758 RepID=A0A1K0GB98_9BASI|nr:uncharacterized protein UBRO_20894 [Ustilago bromivora]